MEYIVQNNDTLQSIAAKHAIPIYSSHDLDNFLESLMVFHYIKMQPVSPISMRPGDTIIIPDNSQRERAGIE